MPNNLKIDSVKSIQPAPAKAADRYRAVQAVTGPDGKTHMPGDEIDGAAFAKSLADSGQVTVVKHGDE